MGRVLSRFLRWAGWGLVLSLASPAWAQAVGSADGWERVGRIADHLLVFGSMFRDYRAGARAAGLPDDRFARAGDTTREAARRLMAMLEPGDVALVKGRDTQRLARVGLILQGRDVGCDIRVCHLRTVSCDECPMLERGWGSHRVVT